MITHERFLKIFLRIMGAASGSALLCALMPYTWMDGIHQGLGMGKLPDAPVVGYLARSTSLFYALLGGLLWTLSFDPHKHRLVLAYLGGAFMFFGLFLLGVDWAEGLPFFWKIWEGPIDTIFGAVIFWCSLGIGRTGQGTSGGVAGPKS